MQGKDDNGNHWITRFVFTETVLKDSHILRSALGSVCLFTYPYSAHTVASDSTGALVPGISVSIPSEEVIWSRWAYNVPGSLALALFGPGSPWLTWSIHEQFQVADFFVKNPRDLALWVERMRTLKEQQYGVFDEGHFVKEFEMALRMVAAEFVQNGVGYRSRVIDARIAQDAPPPSGALPNPPRIDCESSKKLGALERWAMALSNYPSPDSKTLFSLDAARLIFEMFKSTINPGGKCFVDASHHQPILFELAAHAGFHQAFSFMDFDLKLISQYRDFVRPRLNKDQLQAHRVGAAFRDSGCIVWPRNTHLLVLTVPDLKNGMRIWENVLECIQNGTLHHLEVLAVIHDPEFDGADLLRQLRRLTPTWRLNDELTCSNSERFKSEKIIVKLFLRGSAAGLGDGDVLMGDGEEARKDCLPTRSLQSDILISILESDSRHGLFLRELLENPSKTPLREDGHLYLDLEEWNHISRILLENSPGMSVGNVIGSGGFGIVLSTTIFSEDGSRIDESALKLCVALLDHYWNQSGWREFNFMQSMKSYRGSGGRRLGRGGGGPVDLAMGGLTS
jgi:hypothetical protein